MSLTNSIDVSGSLGISHDKVKKHVRNLQIPYEVNRGKYVFSREAFDREYEQNLKSLTEQKTLNSAKRAYKKKKEAEKAEEEAKAEAEKAEKEAKAKAQKKS